MSKAHRGTGIESFLTTEEAHAQSVREKLSKCFTKLKLTVLSRMSASSVTLNLRTTNSTMLKNAGEFFPAVLF